MGARLRALNRQVHDDWILPAADDNGFHRSIRPRVHLLMRNVRRHVDEVPGAGLCNEFQLIAPPESSMSSHDVEDCLQFAMVVWPRGDLGLYDYRTRPEFLCTSTCIRDGGRPRHARRLRRVVVEFPGADHPYTLLLPIRHVRHPPIEYIGRGGATNFDELIS